MLKAFVNHPAHLSRAMGRVTNALKKFAPETVQIVDREADADFVVLHVIDHEGVQDVINRLHERHQTFAIMQYCLRTTQKPNTQQWIRIWNQSRVVWSYYDLHAAMNQDFVPFTERQFGFYHAPLGVDKFVFHFAPQRPAVFRSLTTGYVAESECINEVAQAAHRSGGARLVGNAARVFHLGPQLNLFKFGVQEVQAIDIHDSELAMHYANAEFVAGLRRGEGFELPVLEGFMCGARPIVFDAPHYRQWFHDFAEFIPEGSSEDVIDALTAIFDRGPRPVTLEERNAIAERFDWANLVGGFWDRVRECHN